MRGKNYLWTLFILMFLASVAKISIPTASPEEPTVTFKVDPPITTGVEVGNVVSVNVSIEADPDAAVVGWGISIKVDPDVLEPGYTYLGDVYLVSTGVPGYFLYDWCVANNWDPQPGTPRTLLLVGSRNVTTGVINGTTEYIKKWAYLENGVGNGSDGTGNLATFYFTSKNQTAYSPIEITDAFYCTSWESPDPDYHAPDLIINGHYNEPPVHDVAVTNVVPSTFMVLVGDSVDIDVIVENEGNVEESFTLNLYAGVDLVDTETATLPAGANQTYTLTWTTTAIGNFTIEANVPPVPDEEDTNDNTWTTTAWSINVYPEFPTLIPLLLALAVLAVSTIVLKRRQRKPSTSGSPTTQP